MVKIKAPVVCMFFTHLHLLKKSMEWLRYICGTVILLVVCSSCSLKDRQPDKSLIPGTWKGTASYKQIYERKTYSPALEDSLTTIADSTILIRDILLDVNKDEVRVLGFHPVLASFYFYRWEEETLMFQKKMPPGQIVKDSSGNSAITAYIRTPQAEVLKLDADSLVLHLHVYATDWTEYTVRLKRL